MTNSTNGAPPQVSHGKGAAPKIVVNTRAMAWPTTGVQRYVRELMPHLQGVATIEPALAQHGMAGHAWEQLVLPARLRGRLLWSPSNTGPLAVAQQVVTVHDVVAEDHPEWFQPRLAQWYRFIVPRVARRARHVIAISEFTKGRLIATAGLRESKVTVVRHGIDARYRPQAPEAIAYMRGQLSLPPGPYLLSLGSLEPRKNLHRLLAAWGSVQKAFPEMHLLLAGLRGNPAIFAAMELGAPPDRTVFLGHVPDELLAPLYAGAHAFAYISLYEGFGAPPLEAMACGTPTLASDHTAFPEILGDAAVMVNPLDQGAIAAGLRCVLEDGAAQRRRIEAGLARASLFRWEEAAALTQQIFDRYL